MLLMDLYKTDMKMDYLVESGIGKTIKYLADYCDEYKDDV
jgi:hypothetical protein